jgi:hypothetical protein
MAAAVASVIINTSPEKARNIIANVRMTVVMSSRW